MGKFTFNCSWIVVYADRIPTFVQLIVDYCDIASCPHSIRFPCLMWGTAGVRYCKTVLKL